MKRQPIADPTFEGQLAALLCERGPLAGIAPEILENFVRLGALLELAAGEALVREGDVAAEFYLLLEGALAVRSQGATLVRIDGQGSVVGEAAALLSQKRTADVVAEGAVRAIAVPGGVLARPEFADIAAGIRSASLRDDWVKY